MRKKLLFRIIITIIIAFLLVAFFGSWWILRMKHFCPREEFILSSGQDFEFDAPFSEINRLGFSVDDIKYQPNTEDTLLINLKLRLYDDNNDCIWEKQYDDILAETYRINECKVIEDLHISLEVGQRYRLEYVSDDIEDGLLTVALYGEETSLLPIYIIMLVISFVILSFSYIWCMMGDRKGITNRRFLVLFFVLSILFTVAIPPLSVHDESSHFARAYSISNGILGVEKIDKNGYVNIYQDGLTTLCSTSNRQQLFHFWFNGQYGNQEVKKTTIRMPYISAMKGWVYLLPAVGISIARCLNCSYQIVVISGALCNSILFIVLIAISLHILPRYQMAFKAIILFPSIIWMSISYTYDVWNLGFGILFVAYIIHMKYRDALVGWKDIIILTLIMMALMPVKFVYFGIAFSVLLVGYNRFKNKIWQFGTYFYVIFAGFLIAMIARGRSAISYATTSTVDPRSLYQVNVGENGQKVVEIIERQSISIPWLFEQKNNLVYAMEMLINTILVQGEIYVRRAVNGSYFNFEPPYMLIDFLLFIVIILILIEGYEYKVSTKDRVISIGVFIMGCSIILVAFMFLYSYVHIDEVGIISGVFGRYFLPYVFLLPIGFVSKWIKVDEDKKNWLFIVEIMVVCIIALCNFSALVRLR